LKMGHPREYHNHNEDTAKEFASSVVAAHHIYPHWHLLMVLYGFYRQCYLHRRIVHSHV
jgi:hypothetical protein